ncbi:hypothetical protein V2J09_024197 [Rumex salicifolius]
MGADELLPSPPTKRRRRCFNLLLPCLVLTLATSLSLNVLFGAVILHARRNKNEMSSTGWSKEAAEEAERVAEIACSGHGVAFLDGASDDGNGTVGNPLFLEPFWRNHASSSAVVVSGWHRMGYTFDGNSLVSLQLQNHILKVHAVAGNAVTNGKFIVFGPGSTELLNAAVHALSSLMISNQSSPVKVVASFPYYPIYRSQTDYFKSNLYDFHGDASVWKNHSDTSSDKFIEFVTSPNNPDCQLNKAVLQGPSVKTIHDYAYYWPHFTAIPSPADEDVMIFTLSKLTGHAGSRFGWALIKDEALYEKMKEYVRYNILVLSHETQLRALKLLKVAVEKGEGREIFEFGHGKMRDRWQRLNQVLSKTQRFSLQHIPSQFCNFFQRVREASPAYAWLRCNRVEDTDCYAVLESAGIIGRAGSLFGEGESYVRLSLLKSHDDFDLLIAQIEKLVSVSADEDGSKTM